MKKIKVFQNKYPGYILLLIAGIIIGWLVFHPSEKKGTDQGLQKETKKETIWTCAMHPQIRMTEPGKCPICGMDLIPLNQSDATSVDPDALHMTPEAAQLANVITSRVSKQTPVKETRLYGKVEIDERTIQSQVAHITGRIENLNVNFTGERVTEGQNLGQIYSPDLITAQQELLEAVRTKETQPAIYNAAREKLLQWKLTENQVSEIEKSGKVQSMANIFSNTSGVIISRRVNKGDYVTQGTVLFEIADLSKVWIMFDSYESDLQYMKKGEKISFTLQALPGNSFSGIIIFIDPVIDPVTRVAKVRVEAENRSGNLKPGMFAVGNVSTILSEYNKSLVIPRSSVLWTGERSIVYVRQSGTGDPVFRMREIELGPRLGENYIVKKGLTEGEEIVTSGTFSVDAASQLEGKPSMMNSEIGAGTVSHEPAKMEAIQKKVSETFRVSGNCEMCKDRIEKTSKSVRGVSAANWDIGSKMLNVEFDASVTSLDAIQKAIADAGHDNVKYRAPDEVYSKLPECCLYRK